MDGLIKINMLVDVRGHPVAFVLCPCYSLLTCFCLPLSRFTSSWIVFEGEAVLVVYQKFTLAWANPLRKGVVQPAHLSRRPEMSKTKCLAARPMLQMPFSSRMVLREPFRLGGLSGTKRNVLTRCGIDFFPDKKTCKSCEPLHDSA